MMYLYEDIPGMPIDFKFPPRYLSILKGDESLSIKPWWFVNNFPNNAQFFIKTLNGVGRSKKYLIPFAKVDDDGTGDIACFDGDDFSGDPRILFVGGDEPSHKLADMNWDTRYSEINFDAWLDRVLKNQPSR